MPPVPPLLATRKSTRQRNRKTKKAEREAAEAAANKEVAADEAPTAPPTKRGQKNKNPMSEASVRSPPSKVCPIHQIGAALNAIDEQAPVAPLRRSVRSPRHLRHDPNEGFANGSTPVSKTAKGSCPAKPVATPTTPFAKDAVPPPARKSPRIEKNASDLQGQRKFSNHQKMLARHKTKECKHRIELNGRSGGHTAASDEEGQFLNFCVSWFFVLSPMSHVACLCCRDITMSSVFVTSQCRPFCNVNVFLMSQEHPLDIALADAGYGNGFKEAGDAVDNQADERAKEDSGNGDPPSNGDSGNGDPPANDNSGNGDEGDQRKLLHAVDLLWESY